MEINIQIPAVNKQSVSALITQARDEIDTALSKEKQSTNLRWMLYLRGCKVTNNTLHLVYEAEVWNRHRWYAWFEARGLK